jgi:hypothetical protein
MPVKKRESKFAKMMKSSNNQPADVRMVSNQLDGDSSMIQSNSVIGISFLESQTKSFNATLSVHVDN